MNVLSTLLKRKTPRERIIKVAIAEALSMRQLKTPVPRKATRKLSITGVIGLANKTQRYCSGSLESGKITGVEYINNWVPNWTRKRRSRYLVVNEDTMIPQPNPNPAINSTKNGNRNKTLVG